MDLEGIGMFKFMKILLAITFVFCVSISGTAQSTCPTGFICLTQEQANIAAQNAKDVVLQKAQIVVRDDALKEKDKSIQEVKDTAAQNVADITARLHASENALATSTGQLIGSEAEKVRLLAIIDALLKMTRKKCLPLSVCIN